MKTCSSLAPQVLRTIIIPRPNEVILFSLGEIKSFSTHTFTVDDKAIHFTVDQTLHYEECTHRPPNGETVQRLAVSRTFIHFDDNEQQIVRYAQSNRLATIVGKCVCVCVCRK